MSQTLHLKDSHLSWIIAVLLLPALFINLGSVPLIADEATRGVVAFEMQKTGNLITPTIHGEFYYNKPPLYNWIVLGFFNLAGSYSEWVLRLPAVLSLLLFSLVIYLTTRKEMGEKAAFLGALFFVTCGRVLFYDSMKGLIDLAFSLVVFLDFYVIYYFLSRKRLLPLYLLSYLLASAAFLMKGLPAALFQGLTLVAALAYFRSLRSLFHPSHLAGLAVFIFLTGGYYLLLWRDSGEPAFFSTLVTESTKRTFLEHGFLKTFWHLVYFPFEQAYHLLPWSLLFIYLFRKPFYRRLRENRYAGYLALVFLVNIPVYWVSVGTFPRYLFMLYPVLLILMADHHLAESGSNVIRSGFRKQVQKIRPGWVIIALLVLRIAFNLWVLPHRREQAPQTAEKAAAREIAELTSGRELLIHPVTPASIEFVYYLSTARNEIVRKEYGEFREGVYYIFDDRDPFRKGEEKLLEFESRWKKRKLRLSIIGNDRAGEVHSRSSVGTESGESQK